MGNKSKPKSCNQSNSSIFAAQTKETDHTAKDIFIGNNYLAITTIKHNNKHITSSQTISLSVAPDNTITAQDTKNKKYAEMPEETAPPKSSKDKKSKQDNKIDNIEIADQIKKIGQKIRCDGHIDNHEFYELEAFIKNTQSKLPMKTSIYPF